MIQGIAIHRLLDLIPIADDELEVAADMLRNFAAHWDATNGDRKAQQKLLQLIVGRVWVKGEQVLAMSLRPNYHVTLGLESKQPTEISMGQTFFQNGDDGVRLLLDTAYGWFRRSYASGATHLEPGYLSVAASQQARSHARSASLSMTSRASPSMTEMVLSQPLSPISNWAVWDG